MRKIVTFFLKHPLIGNTLMCFLFLMGIFGFFQLKSTLFPKLDPRLIDIQIVYPGASPKEVEEGIIYKIEQSLNGLSGIEKIRAAAIENGGAIAVEIQKGFDQHLLLQEINNSVNQINSFPQGMEKPIISLAEFQSFVMDFAINGNVSLFTLKEAAQQIEKDLLALDGISKLDHQGIPNEEIEISIREADLQRFNITFIEVSNIIKQTNLEVTAGKIKTRSKDLIIRADNKKNTAEALNNIVLKSNGSGGVVYLHQVADIQQKWEEDSSRSYLNEKPAILFQVRNTINEDILDIIPKLHDYLNNFNETHADIQATIIKDGSEELNERISLLSKNGVYGFLLVIVMLSLFLNWRLAFWVGLSIPICFSGMLLIAAQFGVTINLFSLFGMIIVIGILVDDGIVIAENIYQKYEQGLEPFDAALEGTMEMYPAIFGSILTTIIGFSSIFFIDGVMGQFGVDLAIVVIISLFFSLIECLFILPAHVAHSKALTRTSTPPGFIIRVFNQFMDFLKHTVYHPILKLIIAYPLPILTACFMLFLLTIGSFQAGHIRNTFFPNMPTEKFFVDLKMPAGTNQSVTHMVLKEIEQEAQELNAIYKKTHFNETQENIFIHTVLELSQSSDEGRLVVYLMPAENRGDLTARDLSSQLRDQVKLDQAVEQLQFWVRSGFGKPVDISLLSSDDIALDSATNALTQELQKIDELRDVNADNVKGLKEINISLKPKAAFLGFKLADVIQQIRSGFFGIEVQRLQKGQDEIKIWVRYAVQDRSQETDLAQMRIRGPNLSVPLQEIAYLNFTNGIAQLNHQNGQKAITVTAEITNSSVSVSGVMEKIKTTILPDILKKHPSVSVNYNGEQREQEKTLSTIIIAVAMVFLVIFFLMIFTFKSIVQALIVFLIMPFGLIGIGLGHYLMDMPVSMISILGLGALLGILVNDALVFIITFNENIKAKMSFEAALMQTGITRFRPIVLTSVTTIIGLAPIILEKSLGAQMLIPMAVSVAYGLLVVTVIILVLIPTLLLLFEKMAVLSLRIWENPTSDEVLTSLRTDSTSNASIIIAIGSLVAISLFIGVTYTIWVIVDLFF